MAKSCLSHIFITKDPKNLGANFSFYFLPQNVMKFFKSLNALILTSQYLLSTKIKIASHNFVAQNAAFHAYAIFETHFWPRKYAKCFPSFSMLSESDTHPALARSLTDFSFGKGRFCICNFAYSCNATKPPKCSWYASRSLSLSLPPFAWYPFHQFEGSSFIFSILPKSYRSRGRHG